MPIKGVILVFVIAIAAALICKEDFLSAIRELLSDRKKDNNDNSDNTEEEE